MASSGYGDCRPLCGVCARPDSHAMVQCCVEWLYGKAESCACFSPELTCSLVEIKHVVVVERPNNSCFVGGARVGGTAHAQYCVAPII